VEIIMAAADDRPPEYRLLPGERPSRGKRNFPSPPESGINSENQVRDIQNALIQKFTVGGWSVLQTNISDYMVQALVSPEDRASRRLSDEEQRAENVKRAANNLEIQSDQGGAYYLIYTIPNNEAERQVLETGLRGVRTTFPALAILGIADDESRKTEELQQIDPFRIMMQAKG
jgi:hypothetical protein